MGNANALCRSDDWKALITDAKSRNCYMNMDSLPKDFSISKGPPPNYFPSRFSSGARGSGPGGPWPRLFDIRSESNPGPRLDDDKPKQFLNRRD